MTKILTMGANAAIPDRISLDIPSAGKFDVTALQLYADGKVRGDLDMCFFNQPSIAGGALALEAQGPITRFTAALSSIAAEVTKIVIFATLDTPGSTFAAVPGLRITSNADLAIDIPTGGRSEAALILAELYRHSGSWKIRAIGQGFNGGLAAIATHFGIEVAEEPAAGPAASATAVSLEKKLVRLEKTAPELVSLVKKVGVSLEKNRVSINRAKVALVLDISGSMSRLYSSGKVDALIRRTMALGYRMDDDGEIDVFLFGKDVHDFGAVGVENYTGIVQRLLKDFGLEGGTRYGKAIERVRAFYAANNPENLPVFVMFVTDGGTDDKPKTERELRAASHEPLFWKFMAIQEGTGRFDRQRFEFLDKLDNLDGRLIDNADAFSLSDPSAPSDEEMFDLMMREYETWIGDARRAGLIAA